MGIMDFFGREKKETNNLDNVYSCDICAATEMEDGIVTYWEFRRKSIVLCKDSKHYVDLNTKKHYIWPEFGIELNQEFPMNLVKLSEQLSESQENVSTKRSGR